MVWTQQHITHYYSPSPGHGSANSTSTRRQKEKSQATLLHWYQTTHTTLTHRQVCFIIIILCVVNVEISGSSDIGLNITQYITWDLPYMHIFHRNNPRIHIYWEHLNFLSTLLSVYCRAKLRKACISCEMMTMVDHGHHGFWWFLMVYHVSSWSTIKYHDKVIVLTMVDHGWPLPKWLTIVNHGRPWLTMVKPYKISAHHGWPWSTLIIFNQPWSTIVSLNSQNISWNSLPWNIYLCIYFSKFSYFN